MTKRWCIRVPGRAAWAAPMLSLVCALAISPMVRTDAAAVQLELRVVDELGQGMPARVHIRDAHGRPYPEVPDSILISHNDGWMGAYIYPDGPLLASLPPGSTSITVGKGFEWRPVHLTLNLQQDTSLAITLTRAFDLRAEGWFAGDTHVHTDHLPLDYLVPPPQMLRMAQAEDLSISWILDNEYQFTGGPHALSTPETILYYSTEWRNQAYGHAALLGLKQMIGSGCCLPPSAAYPMLSMVREDWAPGEDEAMSLCHPRTGAGFFDDGGWPAWGLGREAPVLASSGNMDEYDVAAYSNAGDVTLEDWYGFLNCGLQIPPSAGTDATTDFYWSQPPGGYRVYVHELGGPHDPSRWVQGLKAGRVFVTNYPLIPLFTVQDRPAGSVLDVPGPVAVVWVRFRVESALPISSASIIRNGLTAMTLSPPRIPTRQCGNGAFPLS